MMIKHGWQPFITTDELICGDTRAGNGYCIGKAVAKPNRDELLKIIKSGKRVDPIAILAELDERDELAKKANAH